MRFLILLIAAWTAYAQDSSESLSAAVLSMEERAEIAAMAPQDQAIRVVERCLTGHKGALELVDQYAAQWQGKLLFEKSLDALEVAALNSPHYEVRKAAITVAFAQYGMEPSAATAQNLLLNLPENAYALRVRMWQLGMLGFRGFEADGIESLLERYLRDPKEDIRASAADAMGLLGTDATIAPLLDAFLHDPSPVVRDRAGCSIAEGGMLTRAQRRKALPDLLKAMDDTAILPQTRSLVFRALRDITGQQLPSDPQPWRNWQATSKL